jgi:hypothetical protein
LVLQYEVAMFRSGDERQLKQVVASLDARALDMQCMLFKLTMKSHIAKAMENPNSTIHVNRCKVGYPITE